uniref:Circadian clock protein KaiC n=1 Tax=Archaeoglobus fulgidus TaxID=2234 RepID=A0A7C3MAB8_ARCFL
MLERVKSGVIGLDELLGGGFIRNTVNAVVGGTGCGKTIFCMNYILEGLENGEKCIYASPDLDVNEFLRLSKSLWLDFSKYTENGQLSIVKLIAEEITSLIQMAFEYDRIVVDALSPLVVDIESEDRKEISWLLSNLKSKGTAVITVEEPLRQNADLLLFLADSVINMRYTGYGGPYSRTLRVLKHRMSWHADGVYPFYIIEGMGIVIDEKRSDGFEVEELNLPERAMERIRELCRRGVLTSEDFEKIRRRVS